MIMTRATDFAIPRSNAAHPAGLPCGGSLFWIYIALEVLATDVVLLTYESTYGFTARAFETSTLGISPVVPNRVSAYKSIRVRHSSAEPGVWQRIMSPQ